MDDIELEDQTKRKISAEENRVKINKKLEILGIRGRSEEFILAPSFTRFLIEVDSDVKMSVFKSVANDIMAAVSSSKVSILAPIPNSPNVGIDVPNKKRVKVRLKELLSNQDQTRQENLLRVPLGKNINGETIEIDINKAPHLLIAGTTGSGKSVCLNTIIISILYNSRPDQVKLLIIDPKRVEMKAFSKIPHLLSPIITDPFIASEALKEVIKSMEERYSLFEKHNKKNIESFNNYAESKSLVKLPYYLIIIDELADLIMVAAKEVEDSIRRLTQLARAAGIHLIVATQRPSVDVITGVIKANIPSRIAFAVSSHVDSKTIIDSAGAEDLLGMGDMLLNFSGSTEVVRLQGAFVSDLEIEKVVEHVTEQADQSFIFKKINKNKEEN